MRVRTRFRRSLLAAGLLLLGVAAAAQQPPASEARPRVEDVLERSGVRDRPARPRATAYPAFLVRRFLDSRGAHPLGDIVAAAAPWLLRAGGPLLAVTLLLIAVVALRRSLRRRRRSGSPVAGTVTLRGEPPSAGGETPAHWHRRLVACHAAGDVAGTLRCLWWWIACSALGEPAQAGWTTGALARQGVPGRALDLLRRVDAGAFGLRPVGASELAGLIREAERLVA